MHFSFAMMCVTGDRAQPSQQREILEEPSKVWARLIVTLLDDLLSRSSTMGKQPEAKAAGKVSN